MRTLPLVRPATAADAGTIAAMNLAMAAETEGRPRPAERLSAGVRAVFSDPVKGRCFVAEVDGLEPAQGNPRTSGSRSMEDLAVPECLAVRARKGISAQHRGPRRARPARSDDE
jgi:hypothetical protein